MRNARLDETQAGIKIAGRNINNLRYADDTTLMVESKEGWKSLLMKVKEESEKVDLKLNIQKTNIMASSPITSWQMEMVTDFIFLGSKITEDGDCSHEIKRHLAPWKRSYDQPRQLIKKQRHCCTNNDPYSQSYGFSSSHIWMWELDYKESWVQKNWCFWTVVLEKTLESPMDSKEIQPVHPKGDQSWIFIGRTDVEAETPIPWPSDGKNWLTGKDPNPGQDWRWEEKGMTEDEIVGWHHQLDGHEFEQALGIGDGQGSLACCSLWGRIELNYDWVTELRLVSSGLVYIWKAPSGLSCLLSTGIN